MLDILDCLFWMLEGFCKGGYITLEIGEGEAEQINLPYYLHAPVQVVFVVVSSSQWTAAPLAEYCLGWGRRPSGARHTFRACSPGLPCPGDAEHLQCCYVELSVNPRTTKRTLWHTTLVTGLYFLVRISLVEITFTPGGGTPMAKVSFSRSELSSASKATSHCSRSSVSIAAL